MAISIEEKNRAGVLAVGAIFTSLRWAFREQPISDFGIDAQAEKLDGDGSGTGKLIGLQIKTGKSYFRTSGNDFVYYGKARHREYWLTHCLPIFIIIHDPETGLTLFQKVEPHLIRDGLNGAWSIIIPRANVLNEANERFLMEGIATDAVSLRRHRLALDLSLIEQFSEQGEIYLRLEEWQNKTLNFRGVEVVFDEDPEGEADLIWNWMYPSRSVEAFMADTVPWLKIVSHDAEECGGGEILMHVCRVELSDIGKAALTLEVFYREGAPEPEQATFTDPAWLDHMDGLDAAEGPPIPETDEDPF
jgi:hypothetical protein